MSGIWGACLTRLRKAKSSSHNPGWAKKAQFVWFHIIHKQTWTAGCHGSLSVRKNIVRYSMSKGKRKWRSPLHRTAQKSFFTQRKKHEHLRKWDAPTVPLKRHRRCTGSYARPYSTNMNTAIFARLQILRRFPCVQQYQKLQLGTSEIIGLPILLAHEDIKKKKFFWI